MLHFYGIHWDNFEKKPYASGTRIGTKAQTYNMPVISDKTYTFEIGQKRQCIGYFDSVKNERFRCNTPLAEAVKYSQCAACRSRESIAFLHVNGLSYDQLSALKLKKSINYINIFGNKILKTGVTTPGRKYTRILEQGALGAIFFTETDGYTSRVIENLISQILHIRQSVNWNVKISNLAEPVSADKIYTALAIIVHDQIVPVLKDMYADSLLADPAFYFAYNNYLLMLPAYLRYIDYYEQFAYGDVLSGIVIGIYGEVVFLLQSDGTVYGINTKSLQGYHLTITENDSVTVIKHKAKQIYFVNKANNLPLFT